MSSNFHKQRNGLKNRGATEVFLLTNFELLKLLIKSSPNFMIIKITFPNLHGSDFVFFFMDYR